MSQLTPDDLDEIKRKARMRNDWNARALQQWLVAISEQKDRRAYRDFFRKVAPKVKGFALESGYNEAQADQLTEQTLLSVWFRARDYDSAEESVSVWVFKIANEQRKSIILN